MVEHAALLTFSLCGGLLILIPLVFHVHNRNIAVIVLCLELALGNLRVFVNGLVWNKPLDQNLVLGTGYCDVSLRIAYTAQPALMGCAIAVLRYLSRILGSKGASATSRANRTKQNLIDLAIIFTAPIIIIISHLIIFREPRYSIFGFVGCDINIAGSDSPWTLLIYIWSPILGCFALYYALRIVYLLNKKRKDFREILQNSQSGLNMSRFTRLLILAFSAIVLVVPVNFYTFFHQVRLIDIHSTYKIHGNYSSINVYYTPVTDGDMWSYWYQALIALVFAALFGIGQEALNTYRRWFLAVPGSERLLSYTRNSSGAIFGTISKFSRYTSTRSSRESASLTFSSLSDSPIEKLEAGETSVMEMQPMDDIPGHTVSEKAFHGQELSLSDSLTRGHNAVISGHTHSHIWNGTNESPPSPNKIKVRRDLVQHSARKSSLSSMTDMPHS